MFSGIWHCVIGWEVPVFPTRAFILTYLLTYSLALWPSESCDLLNYRCQFFSVHYLLSLSYNWISHRSFSNVLQPSQSRSSHSPSSFQFHSFTPIGTCRMWRFLAILWSFFHFSPLHTFSCHPSPPTILPSSLTSSYHLFLGLPLNLVVPNFIYNTLLGIPFSSILCTCPNQHNLLNLNVSIIVGFFTLA